MSVSAHESPDLSFVYLITAKHCVEAAQREGQDLHIRVNLKAGGSEYLRIRGDWILSDTSDVGVIPILELPDGSEVRTIGDQMAVTDETIRDKNIGIGDELLVVGLFTRHSGKQRNLPILRGGMISAMPSEPLSGQDGVPYYGYLAELRSIGGLSGSPVFVVKENVAVPVASTPNLGIPLRKTQTEFHFLGLVRGHWDETDSQLGDLDMPGGEKAVNMGIAIITPSQDCLAILAGEELTKQRRRMAKEWILKKVAPGDGPPPG